MDANIAMYYAAKIWDAAKNGYCHASQTASTSTFDCDWIDYGTANTTATPWKQYQPAAQYKAKAKDLDLIPKKLPAGARTIEMPDGAKLIIDALGNYRIEDKDAQVQYQANRVREFSPHLNASDLLAQFVKYVGGLGVRQGEVLGLPLELFVNWLIIEAAERDKDPVPEEVVPVPQHPRIRRLLRPKCLACGKFIAREREQQRFPFCSPEHGGRYARRLLLPVERPALEMAEA